MGKGKSKRNLCPICLTILHSNGHCTNTHKYLPNQTQDFEEKMKLYEVPVTTEEQLVECALRVSRETSNILTAKDLIDELTRPEWGDGTGLTWEAWIPESLQVIWSSLPMETKIALFIAAEDAKRFAIDRSDSD